MDTLQRFRRHVLDEWLPKYCSNPKKKYDPTGFEEESLARVSEVDAADCINAIASGTVRDDGHGCFRAHHSTANEYLFWELGPKSLPKRPIRLWLEPVITFAAVERLRSRHGWPVERLGLQPSGWAFDFAAFDSSGQPLILGEVKKTSRELSRLQRDLLKLASGQVRGVLDNSARKWKAIVSMRPHLVLLVGPADECIPYEVAPLDTGVHLIEAGMSALDFSDA